MNVAIIPARLGSKRIKKKNIKNFFNKPAIYWVIKALKKTKMFNKIIVSTDSIKIGNLAKSYGAEVPFLRPNNLSDDFTGTSEVVKHTINWLLKEKVKFKYVCCVYPTAFFINHNDIKTSYNRLKKNRNDYVFSASNLTSSFYRSFFIKKRKIKMMFKDNYVSRTQDFKDLYIDAGQFYWAAKETWLKDKQIFSNNSSIYYLPKNSYVDIDNIEDWKFAEKLFKIKKKTF